MTNWKSVSFLFHFRRAVKFHRLYSVYIFIMTHVKSSIKHMSGLQERDTFGWSAYCGKVVRMEEKGKLESGRGVSPIPLITSQLRETDCTRRFVVCPCRADWAARDWQPAGVLSNQQCTRAQWVSPRAHWLRRVWERMQRGFHTNREHASYL